MPLISESLSTQSREEFCVALKAARERKGVTLASIADATKVPASLFAALERGDLRHWPKGLFRRAFFRGYARMIDVPMTEACAEFVRWFPDDGGAKLTATAGLAHEAIHVPDVRLAFDPAWHGPQASIRSRLIAALLDAAAVVLMSPAVAWVAGVGWSAIIAIVALAYFSLAMVLLGQSPAMWAISSRWSVVDVMTKDGAVPAAWRSGVDAISHWLASAGVGRPGPVEAPEIHSPPLRVRIKLSP